MSVSQGGDKLKGISRRVAAKRRVSRKREEAGYVAGVEPEEAVKRGRKHNGQLLTSMMEVFIRGSDEGDTVVRAARLCENLWHLATRSEDEGIRLAATKMIFERVDGKPVERKEIKSMRIEGIVYIPEAKRIEVEPE